MSAGPVPVVGLDQVEALELSEHVALCHAAPAVAAGLGTRTGSDGYTFELRDELLRWSQLLVTRGPTP